MSYQSDETKAFAFVDEDLAGLPIFGEQPFEIFLCDVVGQVTNEQTTPLCVSLLTGFQQHGQCELLSIDTNAQSNSQTSAYANSTFVFGQRNNKRRILKSR